MFFARVLIGYPTLGNKTMKVCPPNYHTTTDGEHIYVTYHDTQAYGQYLIRYQWKKLYQSQVLKTLFVIPSTLKLHTISLI